MSEPTPPGVPGQPPAERVRVAYQRRNDTDYVFDFWTAFGWTILTCSIYGYYVLYQLVRRSRDHNRRRLELLDGATAFAWEKAQTAGVAEELRPNFERTSNYLGGLRQLASEFRDPVIWLVIAIAVSFVTSFSFRASNNGFRTGGGGVGGIVWIVLFVLLNGDLVRHDYNEGGAESELSAIYTRLGAPVPTPDASQLQQKQNYVGRIVATIFTCGIYGFFWAYNTMDEGNRHFRKNWAWEDALAQSVQQLQAV